MLLWSGTSEVFTEISSAVVVLFGLVWWLEVAVLFGNSLYLQLEVPVSRRYRQATLALPRLGPGLSINRGPDLFMYSRNWCILANRRRNRHIDKISTDSPTSGHRQSRHILLEIEQAEFTCFSVCVATLRFLTFYFLLGILLLLSNLLSWLYEFYLLPILFWLYKFYRLPTPACPPANVSDNPQSPSAVPSDSIYGAVRCDESPLRPGVQASASKYKIKFKRILLILSLLLPSSCAWSPTLSDAPFRPPFFFGIASALLGLTIYFMPSSLKATQTVSLTPDTPVEWDIIETDQTLDWTIPWNEEYLLLHSVGSPIETSESVFAVAPPFDRSESCVTFDADPRHLYIRRVKDMLKMQGRTSPPCTFVGRANAILLDIQVLRSSPHVSDATLDRLERDISKLASRSAQYDVPSTPSVTLSVAPWSLFVEQFVSSHDPSRIVNVILSGLPPVPEESDIPQISLPVGRARAFSTYRRLLDSQDVPSDSWLGRIFGRSSGSRLRQIARCLLTTDDARCLTGALHGDIPLIVDTGASVCITPCREDFVTYQPSKIKIRDLSSSNKVAGEGMVRWVVKDEQGELVTLELPGYHIPKAEVRLLSPQVLFGLVAGDMCLSRDKVIFGLDSGLNFAASFCPRSRLPVLRLFQGKCNKGFFADAFAFTNQDVTSLADNEKLIQSSNTNLSASQKEVLLWHQRLAHASVSWIQLLMRDRKWLSTNNCKHSLHQGPFIPSATERGPTCDISTLKCAACLTAKAHVRNPGVDSSVGSVDDDWSRTKSKKFQAKLNGTKKKKLKAGHTKPGDCVSADHYISAVPGRIASGRAKDGITCGTLFVDHGSGKIFNYCQFSTDAVETIQSKHKLEDEAKREGFSVKKYHSDNGVFASEAFKKDCDSKSQTYSFSGVGAHHQNGVAERNIKTVAQWARACMLHAATHWPARFSIRLWPLALAYAVWVFNRLPQRDTGLCPNEIWSGSRCGHEDFRRAHVFGCPVYVLDPRLQDGKKIPKWDPRARLGMFLGFSPLHSSTVPLVLNLRTGRISPQYHVIFDDKFETVHSVPLGEKVSSQWDKIFSLDCELFLEKEYDKDGRPVTSHIPPLSREWNPDELARSEASGGGRRSRSTGPRRKERGQRSRSTPPLNQVTPNPSIPAPAVSGGVSNGDSLRRSSRRRGTHKDGPAISRRLPVAGEVTTLEDAVLSYHALAEEQAALVANRGGKGQRGVSPSSLHPNHKLTKGYLADRPLHQNNLDDAGINMTCDALYIRDPFDSNLIQEFDPRVLAARATKYNADNPNWDMVMGGEFEAEYWNAMELELDTLYYVLEAWTYVRRTPSMRVLPSIWAFKCKRRADGEAYKCKARFLARGDCQEEGVDFFETWSPVARWTTIRAMMILAAKLRLVSAQCDITAAFIHAKLAPDEHIYVHQPRGFNIGQEFVLKLSRSLYGLRQAPRYFFDYLSTRLIRQGLRQSEHDPCLFYSANIVAIVWVDDLLVYARSDSDIEQFVEGMKQKDVLMRREDTVAGYLGVHIETNGNKTTLTQAGLTKRVVESLGLSSAYSTACHTPAECAPLPRAVDSPPAVGAFNYSAIVGMLLYLVGHSRPDCAFAVHQCARYTFEPKRIHEVALKKIGRYLKGTADKGLIMDPSDDVAIDCYPDADFAGLWGYEDPQDPHCARSRTGYVILLAGCPVVWKSSLQTEIALSTMEAEYVALSTACKELFPVADLIHELSGNLGIKISDTTNMHLRIHEDNVGALTLGKLEPRRMTLRTKHYAIKYHWFRTEVHNPERNVSLLKIDTKNQLGDMFTKGLSKIPFEYLRKKLMGW